MKKFNTVIFDLDGVIIDSKENMRLSWESVRKNLRYIKLLKCILNMLVYPLLKY